MKIEYRKANITDAQLLIDIYNSAFYSDYIAPPIIPCKKNEGRKEIYQGRKTQECSRISSFSDAEKISLCRVFDGKV